MKEKLEAAVRESADKAKSAKSADEAMKYSQAALNLMQALSVLEHMPKCGPVAG